MDGGWWCNYIYSVDYNFTYPPTNQPTDSPKCDGTEEVLFISEIRMDDWAEKDSDTSWRLRNFIGNYTGFSTACTGQH